MWFQAFSSDFRKYVKVPCGLSHARLCLVSYGIHLNPNPCFHMQYYLSLLKGAHIFRQSEVERGTQGHR